MNDTAKPAPAARQDDAVRPIALSRLHAWARNPRGAAADARWPAALDDLMASIRAHGLLENLIVRPKSVKGGDDYTVIAGARRLAALQRLAAEGAWSQPVPCRVIAADDVQALVLALSENLQRADLHPLDEAEAYKSLAGAGLATEAIAGLVAKSRRHVQLRLALAEKLAPALKTAFAEGRLSLAQARVLATAPARQQKHVLGEIASARAKGWPDRYDAAALKRVLHHERPPLAWAIFDRALYTGEIIVDPDDPEPGDGGVPTNGWFADAAEARALQQAAINAKHDALKSVYAWVKVLHAVKNQYFTGYEYAAAKGDDKSKQGAVIEVGRDLAVKVTEGLVERTKPRAGAAQSPGGSTRGAKAVEAPPPKAPEQAYTNAHLLHAHRRKSEALQAAVAADAATAMRLVCLALIGGGGPNDPVRIRPEPNGADDLALHPDVRKQANGFRPAFGKLLRRPSSDGDDERRAGPLLLKESYVGEAQAAAWGALAKLKGEQLSTLFAALVAARVSAGHGINLGDAPPTVTIAETLGVAGKEAKHDLGVLPTDLEGLRRDALLPVCRALGVAPAKTAAATKKAITAALGGQAGGKPGHVLPTLRFATSEQTLKAIRAQAKEAKP